MEATATHTTKEDPTMNTETTDVGPLRHAHNVYVAECQAKMTDAQADEIRVAGLAAAKKVYQRELDGQSREEEYAGSKERYEQTLREVEATHDVHYNGEEGA